LKDHFFCFYNMSDSLSGRFVLAFVQRCSALAPSGFPLLFRSCPQRCSALAPSGFPLLPNCFPDSVSRGRKDGGGGGEQLEQTNAEANAQMPDPHITTLHHNEQHNTQHNIAKAQGHGVSSRLCGCARRSTRTQAMEAGWQRGRAPV
jgi:hypothetical protein